MVMTSTVQASSPQHPVVSTPVRTAEATTTPLISSSSFVLDSNRNNDNNEHRVTMSVCSADTAMDLDSLSSASFDANRLQSASSHEALLRLHDNEIVLLESVKKFASQKSNCDKEYAKKLLDICGQVRKSICSLENNNNIQTSSSCSLPFLAAWNVFLRETERAAELTRANADSVANKLVETFASIVGDKKLGRKKYVDARQALDAEVERAVSLVHQQHGEYVKHVAKNKIVREKYEELYRKSKTGTAKFADAKAKLRKSSTRLHTIHNNYILALEDAKWWKLHRRQKLAPSLLQLHHDGQVSLAAQTKEKLLEFRELCDPTAGNFVECQRTIADEICKFDADRAYVGFSQKHVSSKDAATTEEPALTFDNALLRDYQGTLAEGRIAVDDFTVDDLRIKHKYFVDRQRHFTAQIEKKRNAVAAQETALAERLKRGTNDIGNERANGDGAEVEAIVGNGDDVDTLVGMPSDWRQSRRPTTSSLENLLRESNKSLSSSDIVDVGTSENHVNNVAAFNDNNADDFSPSCNAQRQPSLKQPPSQQPRGSGSSTGTARPLSGASLILDDGAVGESTTESGLRNCSLPSSQSVGGSAQHSPSASRSRHQRQMSGSMASPTTINASDTLTPQSPSKKSVVSVGSTISSFSFKTSGGVVGDDHGVFNGNAETVVPSISDQAPVRRGKGDDVEIFLSTIRHLKRELEVLLCDKERCEAKLELVKSALEACRSGSGGEDELNVPSVIPSDSANNNVDNGSPNNNNGGLTPMAATTARSPFKKNHKNRLTKIFKKGAADPAPPPPVDYPGNDDGGSLMDAQGSTGSDSCSNHTNTGGSGTSGGVSGNATSTPTMTSSSSYPGERRASEEPTSPLHRQAESYSEVEGSARANINRGRTGSLTPSLTNAFSTDSSQPSSNPLSPVGELKHQMSAPASSSNGAVSSGGSTPQTPSAMPPSSFSNGRRSSRTPSATGVNSSSRHSISLDSASLEEEEWFHGILPRDEVVRLLSENGDFLVRETTKSGKKNIVLSVAWNGHKHFMVQKTAEGKFRFEGLAFPSVAELIKSQWESGAPVTVKSGAVLQRQIPRMDWEIRNDDIVLRERIGNGNFGEVYKGILNTTGQDVAIKTCKINLPEDQKKKFLQEGSILKQYNHPNIVKLIGIAAQRQPIMIVMELVDGGSLLSFLRKHGGKSSPKMLVGLCADAAAGMEYLESVRCIHRDLAARNCLVGNVTGSPSEKIVKISDFGMSRENEIYECSDGMKQIPIKWTAPEALNWGRYTSLCDVWSFGILMWEIFSHGSTPYPGWPNPRAREEVERGYRMPAPEGTPDKMYGLMRRCWEYEQENRPHFSELHAEIKSIWESIPPPGSPGH